MEDRTDVFVVGGGPAGLAAAIAARQAGFRVTVADADQPPIEKACGEGLLPNSLGSLARLGVRLDPRDGATFKGIRFVDGDAAPEAHFPQQLGRGVRRKTLHKTLASYAENCGVRLLWRARVAATDDQGILLGRGDRIHTRWIIGADGANSLVRRWAGLDHRIQDHVRFAYRRHYRVRPRTNCVEVHWGSGAQVYITPVGQDEICVAVISDKPRMRVEGALREFPAIASQIENREPLGAERGGISCTLKLRRVWRGRVALLGDAAGCVDAITGEGLGLAFEQAEALGGALAAGDLKRFGAAHRRIMRRASLMSKCLLMLGEWPALRQRVMRTLERRPEIFDRLLAGHVGTGTHGELLANGMKLAWHVVTP